MRAIAALAAAGVPRHRFHDLRHACATLRLEQGEELAVVSRTLGHASITTTANAYGHLTMRCSAEHPNGPTSSSGVISCVEWW